ncbi:hypothetical protein MBRA_05060 [Methylobacterium brachiatum]|jgi:hypothetical protein|nr:hypothetical protein MBRA_05060 [Methylobacterium brachiatum]
MGASDASASADVGEDEGWYLDDAEVRAAVAALTDVDLLRLNKVDARYRGGTDFEPGGLLKGALCQAMIRERKCPRDTSFVKFVAEAIRSTAGHRRRELGRQVSFDVAAPAGFGERRNGLAPVEYLAEPNLDPEAQLIERELPDVVDTMVGLFDGDDDAQLVIVALSEGARGARLYAEVGLTSNQVHYVIRKIRQKAEKLFPGGWVS